MCFLRRLVMSLLLSLCSLASPVLAQSYPFDAFPNLWTPDDRVRSVDIVGDTLYIGGDFEYVGPPTGHLAVLDKQTGEPNIDLPRFNNLEGGVSAVVPDGAGGYFVGGGFNFASGEERHNLAHVLPDGTLNPDFRPDPILDTEPITTGNVLALTLADGILYVGGRFDTVDGEPRQNIAAVDANTGAVLSLQATFAYPSEPAYSPSVQTLLIRDGTLYVGGIFTEVSGHPRSGIAALDAVTGAVLPWRADLAQENPNFFAFPAALAADTTLYLSGFFDFVRGQARDGMAEVSLADSETGEGGKPTAWAPVSPDADRLFAYDLLLFEEYVLAAGSYPGGRPLARIDRETGDVATFPVGAELRFGRSLAYDPVGGPSGEGTLYLVRSFPRRRRRGPGHGAGDWL